MPGPLRTFTARAAETCGGGVGLGVALAAAVGVAAGWALVAGGGVAVTSMAAINGVAVAVTVNVGAGVGVAGTRRAAVYSSIRAKIRVKTRYASTAKTTINEIKTGFLIKNGPLLRIFPVTVVSIL